MGKRLMKNIMVDNERKQAEPATDSNSKFKWLDDLDKYLLKALRNSNTEMEFQINANKLYQC